MYMNVSCNRKKLTQRSIVYVLSSHYNRSSVLILVSNWSFVLDSYLH